MEMCYNGALVMPSSYAVMNEDEMTYVEGGGKVQQAVYAGVKFAGNMAFYAMVGGGTLKAAGTIIKAVGRKYFEAILKSVIVKWVSARVANFILGSVIGFIYSLGTLSMGGFVAEGLDRLDGNNDNQIYFSRIAARMGI